MIRRSLRVGIRLAVLVGVLLAVVKTVQSRRGARDDRWTPPPVPAWPPVEAPAGETATKAGATPVGHEESAGAPAVEKVEKVVPPAKGPAAKGPAAKGPAAKGPAAKQATGRPAAAPPKAGGKRAAAPQRAAAWVEPTGSVCPPSHPVKAKLRSGLFHLPGMAAYDRTTPDRCYPDEQAAVEDGLSRAKR